MRGRTAEFWLKQLISYEIGCFYISPKQLKIGKVRRQSMAWSSLSSLVGVSPPASSALPRHVFPRLLFTDSQPHRLYRTACGRGGGTKSSRPIRGGSWKCEGMLLTLGELGCAAGGLQAVLKFFDCRFSLILRAFPAFHCSVILCGNHEK